MFNKQTSILTKEVVELQIPGSKLKGGDTNLTSLAVALYPLYFIKIVYLNELRLFLKLSNC